MIDEKDVRPAAFTPRHLIDLRFRFAYHAHRVRAFDRIEQSFRVRTRNQPVQTDVIHVNITPRSARHHDVGGQLAARET